MKCTSTGRKCDGYEVEQRSIHLQHIRPSQIPWASATEIRTLEFFRKYVTPMLAGPASFWTDLVPQMTHCEPIARHATMAISSFLQSCGARFCSSGEPDINFALGHYHQAITGMIKANKNLDLDIVVTASILLLVVEFWRADPRTAMIHFTHARRIMESYTPRAELEAIFGYLNLLILLFSDYIDVFPRPRMVRCVVGVGDFWTMAEARETLEVLTGRCVELEFVRLAKEHPEDKIRLQRKSLNEDLDAWFARLCYLEHRSGSLVRAATQLLEARWLVCMVWANDGLRSVAAFSDREYHFRRIVSLAIENELGAGKFTFSMEFATILHFVIRKCRDEKIRHDAQTFFTRACCARADLESQFLSRE